MNYGTVVLITDFLTFSQAVTPIHLETSIQNILNYIIFKANIGQTNALLVKKNCY